MTEFPTFLYTSTRVAKEQENLRYNEIPTLFIYLSLKKVHLYPFRVEPPRIGHYKEYPWGTQYTNISQEAGI